MSAGRGGQRSGSQKSIQEMLSGVRLSSQNALRRSDTSRSSFGSSQARSGGRGSQMNFDLSSDEDIPPKSTIGRGASQFRTSLSSTGKSASSAKSGTDWFTKAGDDDSDEDLRPQSYRTTSRQPLSSSTKKSAPLASAKSNRNTYQNSLSDSDGSLLEPTPNEQQSFNASEDDDSYNSLPKYQSKPGTSRFPKDTFQAKKPASKYIPDKSFDENDISIDSSADFSSNKPPRQPLSVRSSASTNIGGKSSFLQKSGPLDETTRNSLALSRSDATSGVGGNDSSITALSSASTLHPTNKSSFAAAESSLDVTDEELDNGHKKPSSWSNQQRPVPGRQPSSYSYQPKGDFDTPDVSLDATEPDDLPTFQLSTTQVNSPIHTSSPYIHGPSSTEGTRANADSKAGPIYESGTSATRWSADVGLSRISQESAPISEISNASDSATILTTLQQALPGGNKGSGVAKELVFKSTESILGSTGGISASSLPTASLAKQVSSLLAAEENGHDLIPQDPFRSESPVPTGPGRSSAQISSLKPPISASSIMSGTGGFQVSTQNSNLKPTDAQKGPLAGVLSSVESTNSLDSDLEDKKRFLESVEKKHAGKVDYAALNAQPDGDDSSTSREQHSPTSHYSQTHSDSSSASGNDSPVQTDSPDVSRHVPIGTTNKGQHKESKPAAFVGSDSLPNLTDSIPPPPNGLPLSGLLAPSSGIPLPYIRQTAEPSAAFGSYQVHHHVTFSTAPSAGMATGPGSNTVSKDPIPDLTASLVKTSRDDREVPDDGKDGQSSLRQPVQGGRTAWAPNRSKSPTVSVSSLPSWGRSSDDRKQTQVTSTLRKSQTSNISLSPGRHDRKSVEPDAFMLHAQEYAKREDIWKQQIEQYRNRETELLQENTRLMGILQAERSIREQIEQQLRVQNETMLRIQQDNYVLSSKLQDSTSKDIRVRLKSGGRLSNISEEELKKLEQDVKEQERLIGGYQKENERLTEESKEAWSRLKDVEWQKKAEIEKLRTQVVNLQNMLSRRTYESEVYEKEQTIQKLERDFREQYESLQTRAEAREKELSDEVSQHRRELEELRFRLQQNSTENMNHLIDEVNGKNERIADLERKIQWYAENQAIVDRSDALLREKDLMIHDLQNKLKAANQGGQGPPGNAHQAARIKELEKQVSHLDGLLKERQTNSIPAMIRATRATEDEKKATEALRAQTAHLEMENAELRQEMDKRIRSLRQEHDRIRFQYENKIKELETQVSKSKLDAKEKPANATSVRCKELEKQIEDIRTFYTKKVRTLEQKLEQFTHARGAGVTQAAHTKTSGVLDTEEVYQLRQALDMRNKTIQRLNQELEEYRSEGSNHRRTKTSEGIDPRFVRQLQDKIHDLEQELYENALHAEGQTRRTVAWKDSQGADKETLDGLLRQVEVLKMANEAIQKSAQVMIQAAHYEAAERISKLRQEHEQEIAKLKQPSLENGKHAVQGPQYAWEDLPGKDSQHQQTPGGYSRHEERLNSISVQRKLEDAFSELKSVKELWSKDKSTLRDIERALSLSQAEVRHWKDKCHILQMESSKPGSGVPLQMARFEEKVQELERRYMSRESELEQVCDRKSNFIPLIRPK
eukprot:TRINITY_DN3700_c0_g1_i13.p1 TRINITY_DN3700_c0_g1~~TRINITY_DN3700_c0_g1_i13.p1  ORF type:complete len:1598 (+),score=318.53 TRINITY_DN3700_c0_g1_i13:44-4837(+)